MSLKLLRLNSKPKSESEKGSENKSKSRSASKKQSTPKKSPPKKVVHKNIKESETMSRRVKRQKVSSTSMHIKVEEKVKIEEKKTKKPDSNEEKKQKTPQKTQHKKTPKVATPKRNKRVLKEEAKQEHSTPIKGDIKSPKYVNPFEIKKMIETSILTRETIVKSIEFPSCHGGVKVLQHVKEISISTIKKIQSTIQRIKATEKKLKEIQIKTKESLKRKGINLNAKKSTHSKKYEGEY